MFNKFINLMSNIVFFLISKIPVQIRDKLNILIDDDDDDFKWMK